MIQKHKCDTCRRRKIKCDEARPVCTQCSKKRRPCSYNDEHYVEPGTTAVRIRKAQADSNALALIGTQDAEGGALFQTLALKMMGDRLCEPSKPLSNPSTQLASRWTDMLATISDRFAPTGLYDHFLANIPMRIGSHAVVDTAAIYNLECFRRYAMKDTTNSAAEPLGAKALSVLRSTVSSCSVSNEDAVLLSIMLHVMAEYLRGSRDALYMHTKAICDILVARSVAGRWTDIDEALVKAVFQEDIGRAVLLGLPALLDEQHLLDRLQPEHERNAPPVTVTLLGLIVQMIKIPGLVALVRGCIEQPHDTLQKAQTLYLAKTLYKYQIGPHSTTTPDDMPPRYYTFRLRICGVVQRLRDLNIASEEDFDFDNVLAEEEHIANIFTRDLPGYFDPFQSAPWKAMRFTALVTAYYGAWNRIEERRRAGAASSQSREQAAEMIKYCLQLHANALGTAVDSNSETLLKQVSDMVDGGPLFPPSSFLPAPLNSAAHNTSVARPGDSWYFYS